MADPIVPNFIDGVGRLATDRFSYEKHINGTSDRHKANQIDLFPTIVIGTPQNNVQDAISAIATIIGTPPPDATTTVKGIVKLAGDIAGTATNVVVTKIQGKPISSLVPSSGDVLTWDGSTWKPQSISGTFTNLNVTGNTTLGTNSSNTLVVNAQVTLSNNLTVNGNIALGNANSDSTTIQGILTVSGGNVSITGATAANFASNGSLTLAGTTSTALTSGASVNISSGSTTSINAASTLSINSSGNTTITSTTGGIVVNALYQIFNANIQVNNSYNLSLNTGSSFYVYPGVSFTMNSSIVMAGFSKINKRYTNGPNSNSNIFPAQYDVFFGANLTTNRQWTIDESFGATLPGIDFEVVNNSIYTITIYDPTLTTLVTIGSSQACTIYRDTTLWKVKYKYNMV